MSKFLYILSCGISFLACLLLSIGTEEGPPTLKQEKKMASLKTVLDDELTDFLSSIGVLGDIEASRLRCKFCERIVTLENFHAVFPDSGNISAVCSNPECSKDLSEYLYKQKVQVA